MTKDEMIAELKSDTWLNLSGSDSTLGLLIDSVLARISNFLGEDDDLTVDELGNDTTMSVIKQVSYEFRRRDDPGLETVTYSDGTIKKSRITEFLPEVKSVLERKIWDNYTLSN